MVVAVPGTLGVQWDEEEVAALEVRQHRRAVRVAGDGVTQGSGESVEDRSAEQEVADLSRLTSENLVSQVVDDEPVTPGKRLDEASDLTPLREAA